MIRPVALVLCTALALSAADGPTEAEWLPVQRVLASNRPQDAIGPLQTLLARHKRWADGHREMARAQLFAKDGKAAYAAAFQALGIDPADSEAAALAVVALGMQNRTDDALKIADRYAGAKDPAGAVAFRAAEVLAAAGRFAEAKPRLDDALGRMGANAKADQHVLAGRIAIRTGDIAAAETSYIRALTLQPDHQLARFELGRVRIQLASTDPDRRVALLKQAIDVLEPLARTWTRDGSYQLALGKALLERGRDRVANGDDGGLADFRSAVGPLRAGHQLLPDDRNGRLWLGDALLRSEQYEEAVPHLQAAYDAGAPDRSLPFNLALALNRVGRSSDAERLLAGMKAGSPQESMVLGMQNAQAHNWALASTLIERGLPALAGDDEAAIANRAAALRWLGHCHREIGGAAFRVGDADGGAKALDAARDAYRQAGDLGDQDARRWYYASEIPRSPQHAYDAGWRKLDWESLASPSGWALIASNYNAVATGGEGLGGMASRKPLHLVAWILLVLAPLAAFVGIWVRRRGQPDPEPGPKPSRRETQATTEELPAKPAARPASRVAARPASRVAKPAATEDDSARATVPAAKDTGALERRKPARPAGSASGESPFAPGKTPPKRPGAR